MASVRRISARAGARAARLGRRAAWRMRWPAVFLVGAVLGAALFARFAPLTPLDDAQLVQGAVVLDREGRLIQRDLTDGVRIPVPLHQIAPVMVAATIAAEDDRFYAHPGVDPIAVARAAVRLPWERSGASTITQQLARRLYLDSGLPLPLRKAREAAMALQLEARYDKDTILEAYLNNIYYGRGAYGVEAAARVYFGVSAANLDLGQAAFLAGLPQNPVEYSDADTDAGRDRRDYVLRRLDQTGRADPGAVADARARPLRFTPADPPPHAQHFVGYVYAELARLRPDLLDTPGLIIETTLDLALQTEAERIVAYRLDEIEDHHATSAAVVVLDPDTGAVRAMVGSGDFFREPDGQVNMAVQPRQPGSALKPLLYVAAFERGYQPATQLLDVPTTFQTNRGPYAPRNYDGKFHGPVSLRTALASSLNVPAVRTLDDLGIDALLTVAQRFGLHTLTSVEAYGLALTLGVGEVTLLDLTSAYGAFATGGAHVSPTAIARIRDHTGAVVYEAPTPTPVTVVSPQRAFLITDILRDPDARLLGFGPDSVLQTPQRAAVKTGTSDSSRDNWTVGYTRDLAVGVWVGNADGSPMSDISGVSGAGPIWRDVLATATAGRPARPFDVPPGLVRVTVCGPTGLLPGPHCQSPVVDWFEADAIPTGTETYYLRESGRGIVLNPPAEARAWSAEAGLQLASPTTIATAAVTAQADPGRTVSATPATDPNAVHIVQPGAGAVLFLAPELTAQQTIFRASVPPGAERVEFWLNGRLIGVADDPAAGASAVWRLQPGLHELQVRAVMADGPTAAASTHFEVRQ